MGGIEKSLARRHQTKSMFFCYHYIHEKHGKTITSTPDEFLDSRLSKRLAVHQQRLSRQIWPSNMLLADNSARQCKPFTWQPTWWLWCSLQMRFLSWISRKQTPHPFVRFCQEHRMKSECCWTDWTNWNNMSGVQWCPGQNASWWQAFAQPPAVLGWHLHNYLPVACRTCHIYNVPPWGKTLYIHSKCVSSCWLILAGCIGKAQNQPKQSFIKKYQNASQSWSISGGALAHVGTPSSSIFSTKQTQKTCQWVKKPRLMAWLASHRWVRKLPETTNLHQPMLLLRGPASAEAWKVALHNWPQSKVICQRA